MRSLSSLSSQSISSSQSNLEAKPYSLFIACGVITVWAVSLLTLLHLNLEGLGPLWVGLAMLWQTFLYTGLFITAHDAMHGAISPKNPRINQFFGTLTLLLYGLFSYKKLLKAHWLHHQHPASDRDPDFHDGRHKNFFAWYFHFMQSYWSWTRLVALAALYNLISWSLHIPESNLTLFWVVPSLLSSVQLFYFGTFLPHREPANGYQDEFRAQSIYRSVFWSFITCYHFGYHREHHAFPNVPWWRLPTIARQQ